MSIQNNELPQNPSIESETIRPFRRFCTTIMTIGSLPSSYQEAMSYQEMLLWLCDFIENKVIPAFDNNANAIKELQNLYVELKSYVDNYFTNLDVQEEINNKLDKMATDGTFYNLINNLLFTNMNNQIINNSNEITKLKNANNNFVSKNEANSITMNMLSQDVKESMTGGSTPVVEENSITSFNIVDDSLDILTLDKILSNNFIKNYEYLDLSSYSKLDGQIRFNKENGTYYVFKTDVNFAYIKIPLTFNKIYNALTVNYGLSTGLCVIDDNEKVVFSSDDGLTSGNRPVNTIFRAKENYKYALITISTGTTYYNDIYKYYNQLAILDNIITLNKFNKKRLINYNEALYSVQNNYLSYINQNYPEQSSNKGASLYMFPIKKGLKYEVNSSNFQNSAGMCICDESLKISYISSTQATSQRTDFQYTFTAQFDGFLILSNANSNMNGTVYVYDDFMDNYKINLSNLKIGFIGDSICYGSGYKGGYAKCLNNLYGLNYQNLGVSGGRIAKNTINGGSFFICDNINNFDNDLDGICIEGGINDFYNETPIGELVWDYVTEIDDTTFIGALEKIFRDCASNYPDVPVFFLISHNSNKALTNYNEINLQFSDYIDAIYKVCKKYGIHIINIAQDTNFNTGISETIKNNYTNKSDGLHPNEAGYNKYYVPLLVDYINNVINSSLYT